ncbi:N-acetyltransferase domain-containing protein [Mycobacterium sp. smrl_JER01]
MPVNEFICVRQAVPEDASAVARAHVRSWQVGYRGLLPIGYLNALRPEERASRYAFDQMNPDGPFTQVALVGDMICGHVTTGRCRDDDLQGNGEIWAIYVDPPHWGCGIGSRLIAAGCAHLRNRGYHKASLWVLSGNDRARRFYGSVGWRCDGAERTDSIGGHPVHEVRYQRSLQSTKDASHF